jgi:tetratricopeptide (TPR) repeat protein
MLATVGSVQAQTLIPGYPDQVRAYDPRDVAMLPAYCKYTQEFQERVPGGNDPDAIERWKVVLGPTYIHLHHYCWGMMKANRGSYMARSRFARNHYLSDAIGEFNYVIERSPETFVLLPEILSRKGETLVRLGRGGEAVLSFERSLQIKPDYWPPYGHLADYYKEMGDPAKAREMLERGLKEVPDAAALKRRVAELDGKSAAPTSK